VTALDEILDRLETLDEDGDDERLREELERALARFPDAPELREWEAALAADEERYEDALAILDAVLAAHPRRTWARRERAAVLIDLGRFDDALAALRAVPAGDRRAFDRAERASIHYDLGLCLDRLGQPAEADAEFRQASRLAPADFPLPLRLSEERFAALVAEALDSIPEEFAPYVAQVVVRVRDWPAPDDEDPFLLGMYVGVARPERTLATEDHLDHVLVFKRPHELRCAGEDALRDEVRRTVVHEIAHHFGIAHDDMGEYR
jgi:predicted Zn-dependent protease with MMP-like domain